MGEELRIERYRGNCTVCEHQGDLKVCTECYKDPKHKYWKFDEKLRKFEVWGRIKQKNE
jgi:hypothetical protein